MYVCMHIYIYAHTSQMTHIGCMCWVYSHPQTHPSTHTFSHSPLRLCNAVILNLMLLFFFEILFQFSHKINPSTTMNRVHHSRGKQILELSKKMTKDDNYGELKTSSNCSQSRRGYQANIKTSYVTSQSSRAASSAKKKSCNVISQSSRGSISTQKKSRSDAVTNQFSGYSSSKNKSNRVPSQSAKKRPTSHVISKFRLDSSSANKPGYVKKLFSNYSSPTKKNLGLLRCASVTPPRRIKGPPAKCLTRYYARKKIRQTKFTVDSDDDYVPDTDNESESTDEDAQVDDVVSVIPSTPDIPAEQQHDVMVAPDVLENIGAHEEVTTTAAVVGSKVATRKRKRAPERWKRNIRKQLRDSGQSYVNRRGKQVLAKSVRGTCGESCKNKCSSIVSTEDQNEQFLQFYKLSDFEKRMYISRTTQRTETRRKTKQSTDSRRKYSYNFFFESFGESKQVCKKFYLATLAISQKQIYTVHEATNVATGVPERSKSGKHIKNMVSDEAKQYVHDHIQSIPVLESHYRRENTNKKYFEDTTLSVKKLYNRYLSWLPEGKEPVKESMYRNIFDFTYNYEFSAPRNDICDTCSLFDAKSKNGIATVEEELEFEWHHHNKNAVKKDRDNDRKLCDRIIICFDLENVFTLPKCGVGSFFYKRKLTCYNLTAHVQLRTKKNGIIKKYYSCIWNESQAGRGGDVLASTFITILKRVCEDFPDNEHITTWSDSCVPQNRNQMMAFAVQHFLQNQNQIKTITMKYCTPGHSTIQEVYTCL